MGVEGTVCDLTVQRGMCVGCGVCAGTCPSGNLRMEVNTYGAYNPARSGSCINGCGHCVSVCPFIDHAHNEDTLAQLEFGGIKWSRHAVAGYWLQAWAGFASAGEYRQNAASGGMASWFLSTLLRAGIVDKVACVRSMPNARRLFEFSICECVEDVQRSSKSAYYPVEISGVLQTILDTNATFAVIGLPCFVKALRLAMLDNARLRSRIVLVAGLVCGQLKSMAYADYLIRISGLTADRVTHVSFRERQPGRLADDFLFRADEGDRTAFLPFRGLYGSSWMTGQLKLRACNYCDDVFAELADIVFMDGWLPEFIEDHYGWSIVIARSLLAARVIQEGMASGETNLHEISMSESVSSQAGLVRQKRDILALRLWTDDRREIYRPSKRVTPRKPSLYHWVLLSTNEYLRRTSHEAMRLQRRLSKHGTLVYMIMTTIPLISFLVVDRLRQVPSLVGIVVRRIRQLVFRECHR